MSTVTVRTRTIDEIARARNLTDSILHRVHPDAMYERPIPERHRLLFYVGHLEAFDWNQIARSALGLGPVSEELDRLFAFGIDPPPGRLPQDEPGEWPSLEHTSGYARLVRERLDAEIESAPEEALLVALEHRLMHAETLTYLLHNLPYHQRRLTDAQIETRGDSPALQMIEIPGGKATLGQARGEEFGWDNEFERHARQVPAFRMSRHKITNGQYLEFVNAGGPVPHYWSKGQERFTYRGLNAETELPADVPVYVTHQQAEVYARWAGKSLPTEAQYHRAAFGTPKGGERPFPWGDEAPTERHGNFHFYYNDLLPVTASPAGDSAFGISQLVGNGWEWTADPFGPFQGFAPKPSYKGYSADFFDNDHFVLKGGSCVTDARLLRRSFRNWFRKEYPYAYTTFRVVEN